MEDSSEATPPTFQLGLVLAGAVSGGAYTAGVLDFLFEALDAFESAKVRGDRDCPRHRVEIRVITGTSAGAMCAGLALAALLDRRGSRPLYEAWVKRVSIDKLLETRDLGADNPHVVSLLDATVLEDIAEALLPDPGAPARVFPSYVSPTLSVGLCTAALRGVPYSIAFGGNGATYGMRLHAMERWFHTGSGVDRSDGWNPSTGGPPSWWRSLRDTCIASGAFPVGLAPRRLSFARAEIDAREWPTAGPDGPTTVKIPPAWYAAEPDVFVADHVDGGVFDNEPLELARTTLVGNRLGHNERDGARASRAVIMVDPFVEASIDPPPRDPPGIFTAIGLAGAAFLHNSRFKPDEIALALDDTIYSRFLVAPERDRPGDNRFVLASGALSAFGGFFSEAFREHDYALGRRNCQQFLKQWLVLPKANGIVAGWCHEACERHAVDRDGDSSITGEARGFRPLIPLRDEVSAEEAAPTWPAWPSADAERLKPALRRRADAVVRALIGEYLSKSELVAMGARMAWRASARLAVEGMLTRVRAGLAARGLSMR